MDAHHSHHFEFPEYVEHHVPLATYLAVFGALMVLTVITVAVAFVDLGAANVVVALAVAIVKAVLVVLFFMHVKYSSRMVQLVVIAALAWLLILLGITLSDYLTRGWLMAPPLVG
jgi:cytochrome c oxidase subunit IV